MLGARPTKRLACSVFGQSVASGGAARGEIYEELLSLEVGSYSVCNGCFHAMRCDLINGGETRSLINLVLALDDARTSHT